MRAAEPRKLRRGRDARCVFELKTPPAPSLCPGCLLAPQARLPGAMLSALVSVWRWAAALAVTLRLE